MKMLLCKAAGGLLSILFVSGGALAADWPDRVVRIVAPYGPGGGVDTFTRPISARLALTLGQPVIVDNRPGAGGTVGVRNVAESPADGYTVLSGGVHQPMAEELYPKRGFDIGKDFVPVTLTALVPTVLVVANAAPFKTVQELIAYAKDNPGKVDYCSSGNGTAQHISAESFKRLAGVAMTHIPYRGTAAAMTDLVGGQCMLMFDGLGTSAQQIRAGKIRLLAVAGHTRTRLFPDTPTLKEAGGPDMDATIWYGWWVRKGTPAPIVSRLAESVRTALRDPAVVEAWKAQGAAVPELNDAEISRYIQAEVVRWRKAIVDLGIKTD